MGAAYADGGKGMTAPMSESERKLWEQIEERRRDKSFTSRVKRLIKRDRELLDRLSRT